jgi:hypothetical protein
MIDIRFQEIIRGAAAVLLCAHLLCAQSVHLDDAPGPVTSTGSTSKAARTFAAVAPAAAGNWYDPSNREAVRSAYNNVFVPTAGKPLDYIGDPANGIAGDTSAAYKSAVVSRINFFRAMAGVPAIAGLDAARNAKAQQGALMLYANQALSHEPPPTWLRYSANGAEALGKSNICQGKSSDAGCVSLYMDDFGSNNALVGHRRWLLYPNTQFMGTGDVPEGTIRLWNVVWVIDSASYGGPRPSTRDAFVAWPPKGYVPYQLLYNRWHFSYPSADFSGASVTVSRDGANLPVRIDSANAVGYGDNSIVFVPNSVPTADPTVPAKPSADTRYHVKISNALVQGAPATFEYDVTVFDPAIVGVAPPTPGTPGVVSFAPLSGSGYTGTFTATFTQSSNNHYLGYMLFLPTPNVVNYTATGSCLVEYNKYSNGVRLIDNAGTDWLGPISGVPITPSAPILVNNQCSVNVANVVANVSGSTMTLTIPVTFFQSLGPVLGTFLQAEDSNGVWTGMTQFGNWLLPGAPQIRSGPAIASASASATAGRQATYTLTTTHTSGVQALSMIHFLASAEVVGSPACQIVYFPSANVLNMVNDAGTALVSATGIAAGQAGLLTNTRCSVNTSLASRTQTPSALTLTIPVNYAVGFAGQKTVYFNAFDNAGLLTHWVTGSTMLVQ